VVAFCEHRDYFVLELFVRWRIEIRSGNYPLDSFLEIHPVGGHDERAKGIDDLSA
jgi:hypothetical protein